MFKYCDNEGNLNEASNVNGSLLNIAGICNATRNVFGMMPHPERAVDPFNENTDGAKIFDSILNAITA